MHAYFNKVGNQNQNGVLPNNDYIPVISTFQTIMVLFRKARIYCEDTCGSGTSQERLIYDYNYALANNRSLTRCIAPLVPVIGNIFAYRLDQVTPENLDPVQLFKSTIQNASISEKIEIAESLARTNIQALVENISDFDSGMNGFDIAKVFVTIERQKNARYLPDCVGKLKIGEPARLFQLFKSVAVHNLWVLSVEGLCKFLGDRKTIVQMTDCGFFSEFFTSSRFNYCGRAAMAGSQEKLAMAELLVLARGRDYLMKDIHCFSTNDPEHNFKLVQIILDFRPLTVDGTLSMDCESTVPYFMSPEKKKKSYVNALIDALKILNLGELDLEKKKVLALSLFRLWPAQTESLLKEYGITQENVLAFPREVKREIFPGFAGSTLLDLAKMGSSEDKLLILDELLSRGSWIDVLNFSYFITHDEEHNFQLLRIIISHDGFNLERMSNFNWEFRDPYRKLYWDINVYRYAQGAVRCQSPILESLLAELLKLGTNASSDPALFARIKEELQMALNDLTISSATMHLPYIYDEIARSPNELKLMFAKSLLSSNYGHTLESCIAQFMTEDEEHNFDLAKLFVTTPNSVAGAANARHLAACIDRLKLADPNKRLELAKMVCEVDARACAQNIERFDLSSFRNSDIFFTLPFHLVLAMEPNPSPDLITTLAKKNVKFLVSTYNLLRRKCKADGPLNIFRRIRERESENLPTDDLEQALRKKMNLSPAAIAALFIYDDVHPQPILVNPNEVSRVNYLPYIREKNFKWVVPFFFMEDLREAVCTFPNLFPQLIPLVTKDKKEAFFRDAALHQQIVEWSSERWQSRLTGGESLHHVQTEWTARRLSLMQVIAICSKTLNTLSKMKLTQELTSFVESAKHRLQTVEEEMELFQALIISQHTASKDLVEIPDEFLCPILGVPMQQPMRLKDSEGTAEFAAWEHAKGKSPFNRDPFTMDDLIVDAELKARIDTWKKEHPHAWALALSQ